MTSFVQQKYILLLLLLTVSVSLSAQSFTTLAFFDGTNGAYPEAGLVQGPGGNFYGTTALGGIFNSQCQEGSCGTVFKLTPSGILTTVYKFCDQPNCTDGYEPYAGLTLGLDDSLYGTASQGGVDLGDAGTVFKISSGGTFIPIHSFCTPSCLDGALPTTALVNATDGSFYGTTQNGGSDGTFGNVFKMSPAGNTTSIFSFNGIDGMWPNGLLQANDGNFYGTTNGGGSGTGCYSQYGGCGTVFKLTPQGKFMVLHNFCVGDCFDGDTPSSLIQASDGNLYGVTVTGGPRTFDGFGTIFRITTGGKFTTVYSFCPQAPNCSDGINPTSLVQASDGNFYGTTGSGGDTNCNAGFDGCGTIFKASSVGSVTTLHTFEADEGFFPIGLSQATSGVFYGVTVNSGIVLSSCTQDCGMIFSFSDDLAPFISIVRKVGKIGQSNGIIGQGFTGATAVSFNGTSAAFAIISDTFIKTTVPTGATSGFVTVATPGGTLKSNSPFRVIP